LPVFCFVNVDDDYVAGFVMWSSSDPVEFHLLPLAVDDVPVMRLD